MPEEEVADNMNNYNEYGPEAYMYRDNLMSPPNNEMNYDRNYF